MNDVFGFQSGGGGTSPSGTILGTIDPIAGVVAFGTGVLDTLTTDPLFYFTGNRLFVPSVNTEEVTSTADLLIDVTGTGTLNLGTGTTAKTVKIGNATTSTAVLVTSGTGSSGWTTTNGRWTLATGTGNVLIGTDVVSKSITLGNTVTTSQLNLISGIGSTTYLNGVFTLGTTVASPLSYNTDFDSIHVIARAVDSSTVSNAHGYVDATVFTKLTGNLANNAFTDNGKIGNPSGGTGNYNHHCSFQSQFEFRNTGGTTTDFFFMSDYVLMTSGTLTNRYGHYYADSTGAGIVVNQYGLYVPTISKGTTINHAIHIVSNDSYFGGKIKMVTTSGAANTLAPEIAWYHATTVKTSYIQDKIITNTSELKFFVSNYNFTGYKEMLTIRGDDTNAGADYAIINSTKLGFYNVTPVARATNAGGASAFVANTSLIADDTATFGGYTIGQVVKALISVGVLT